MNTPVTFLKKFFGVPLRGQTYLNMLYLLLAFPLGLFYFIFLVSGLSIGVATIIIWIGILFLLAVFAVWYGLVVFERQMAIWLLRVNIPPVERPGDAVPNQSTWQRFKTTIANPVTWKGLVYLFAKFPLGITSFVLVVTFVAVSVSLIAAPFYYAFVPVNINLDLFNGYNPIWAVDTLWEAVLVSLGGIFLTFIFMHILNGLAWVSGQFARLMLGYYAPAPAAAAPALAATPTIMAEPAPAVFTDAVVAEPQAMVPPTEPNLPEDSSQL
jgi:hypothetical protein